MDAVHHVAISTDNIATAVEWYCSMFRCEVTYQDETWAMLKFANISLALVIPEQHPPHVAFVTPRALESSVLKTHRDGTRSVYVSDPAGNPVELMDPESV